MSKARNLSNLVSTEDSIIMPSGTTAERPANPSVGMIRYNTTTGYFESYTTSGWGSITTPPIINSVSPSTYNGSSGTTFTINGAAFDSSSNVKFITTNGVEHAAATVVFVNSNQLTATTPQIFTVADEPLDIKVSSNSGFANTLYDCIDCGGLPAWSTASGSIGTCYDIMRVGFSVTISAVDPESQSVTYSLYSGSLPSGMSLNTSTGLISGTPSPVVSDTTSNFTIRATDTTNNTSDRSFSITVKAPVTVTYNGIGADQTFSVPTGLSKLTAKMWGAGGGNSNGAGGAGGFASGIISTTGLSSTFIVVVGAGGSAYGPNNSGGNWSPYGGGGNAAAIGFSAQGGGLSGIFNSSKSQGNSLLIAGGGGGGGWDSAPGGAGGGTTGGNGSGNNSGSGGTQSAGGSNPISGANGSALQGGSAPSSGDSGGGGGGGGGYWGGGGGYNGDSPAGNSGGGGGSGYYHPTYVSSPTLTGGSGTTPGNSGDSDRNGKGAAATAGLVIISY